MLNNRGTHPYTLGDTAKILRANPLMEQLRKAEARAYYASKNGAPSVTKRSSRT